MQTLSPRTTFPLVLMAVALLATAPVLAGSHPGVADGGRSISSSSVQQGLPATQGGWQPAAQPAYRFAHLGSAVPYNGVAAGCCHPGVGPAYYAAPVTPQYVYAAPQAFVPLHVYPSMIYVPTYADAYTTHFGPGFYRYGESGHYRFPYYSYRRPWYFPGHPTFNRNTNLTW